MINLFVLQNGRLSQEQVEDRNELLQYANPLVKVTIVPRGQSLGAAWYLPEERLIVRPEQMLDEMCATLGGRAAEKVIFNKISHS